MKAPAETRRVSPGDELLEEPLVAAAVGRSATRGHTLRPTSGSGAILGRIAELHAELSTAYRDLAETLGNRLDVLSVVSAAVGVDTLPATRSNARDFLTVRDVAQRLQVDVKTVRRWRHEGKLPRAFSNGSIIRWESEDIDAWIEDQTR